MEKGAKLRLEIIIWGGGYSTNVHSVCTVLYATAWPLPLLALKLATTPVLSSS